MADHLVELENKSEFSLPKTVTEKSAKATEPTEKKKASSKGLHFRRFLTKDGQHPFDTVEWEKRTSLIRDEKGKIIYENKQVEVPSSWSQLATDIIAYKYFRKRGVPASIATAGQETSAQQTIHRIAHSIRLSGEAQGNYFAKPEDADIFEAELTYLLTHQMGAFNSPVWFNVGLYEAYGIKGSGGLYRWDEATQQVLETESAYENPQCSACFIHSLDDDLNSIFEGVKTEVRLFKYGSGAGANFSHLRSKYERLSGGGISSGVMSFLKVYDAAGGAIKSGGTTRRAAKMVVLDMDHPEIEDFIWWKVKEEKKAKILIEYGGYPADFNGEAYSTVSGQNSNNSVRVTDAFMQAVENDESWNTTFRTTGEVHKTFKARDLMHQIAEAAWTCADPGMQYDTTINAWHTCPNTDRIYASNPCSEYMFLDNSACNLASLNLIKYLRDDGTFDVPKFRHAVRVFTTAMDIIVDYAAYPTGPIAENSHNYRPLGLGYANLGTLLMLQGIAYDSDEGRTWAGAISSIEHAEAYRTSAEIASTKGAFTGYIKNRQPFLQVMAKHRAASYALAPDKAPDYLITAAHQTNDDMVTLGEKNGFRNAQATVIAPTGTIGLLMDCATTGIEPDFALVKFKKLAGGGFFKIINESIPIALTRLGYSDGEIKDIITYAMGTASLSGAPHINPVSLQAKGLTEADIQAVDALLKGSFELTHAFNASTLGEATMERLGIAKSVYEAPNFNLLEHLGYTAKEIEEATDVICGRMTVEGAPHLKDAHLSIFDCANRCGKYGTRYIAPMGHVKMMAAVQPFISGAISKTVNLPNEATIDEIQQIYVDSWKLGLKAIALYRDGSKGSQALYTSATKKDEKAKEIVQVVYKVERRRMPTNRQALTHKFSIAGHDGYVTVGMYEDGTPGEIFIRMAKTGSTINGLIDAFATMTSLALQYGVPLTVVVKKFSHLRFEPSGFTGNPNIRFARSIIDYIARWLGQTFLTAEDQALIGFEVPTQSASSDQLPLTVVAAAKTTATPPPAKTNTPASVNAATNNQPGDSSDAPPCPDCGSITLRNGTCYKCPNCGSTTGCS